MQTPPIAERDPVTRTHHGDTVIDEYEWLRNAQDPRTHAYLDDENTWTEQQTAHQAGLRDQIYHEISNRTRHTDMSVPTRHGSWWYYVRTIENQQYAVHCRRPIAHNDDWTPPSPDEPSPQEQVLLDCNAEAEGHEFFSLGAFSVSQDDRWLAWSVDTRGDERFTIRIKDLSNGEIIDDVITGVAPGATWSADAGYVFYTTLDDAWRPDSIWRHEVGAGTEDVRVFYEPDERFFIGIGTSQSERWLVISASSKTTSEVLVLDAHRPTDAFAPVWPRRDGVEYGLEHVVVDGHDEFWILHNDGAQDFELVRVPVDAVDQVDVVVPAQSGVRLEDIDAFAGHVLVSYRQDALARIGVIRLNTDGPLQLDPVEFDAELYTAGVGANAQWEQPFVRVGMTSFTIPPRVYDLEIATGTLFLRKELPVLGDFDPDDYVQYRRWATADDGTLVPVSIVAHRKVEGPAPTLLYGYGSYEISVDPGFSIPRLSLLDRGMIFAVAHVRGGGELGRQWYDDGKLLHKRNTFTDFIACARLLVDEGWTAPDRLVAEGGSAGGLLMGAVANMAPQLFCGILANVPFVDPLTSILDPSLPLTVIEWDEWGNPLDDPEVYAYMKSYSPYENVAAQDYPAIAAVTSLHDTRVLYAEPAKWIARLRQHGTGDKPIVLKTEMSAGHGGVSGRYRAWHERAWELAWILDCVQPAHAIQ